MNPSPGHVVWEEIRPHLLAATPPVIAIAAAIVIRCFERARLEPMVYHDLRECDFFKSQLNDTRDNIERLVRAIVQGWQSRIDLTNALFAAFSSAAIFLIDGLIAHALVLLLWMVVLGSLSAFLFSQSLAQSGLPYRSIFFRTENGNDWYFWMILLSNAAISLAILSIGNMIAIWS